MKENAEKDLKKRDKITTSKKATLGEDLGYKTMNKVSRLADRLKTSRPFKVTAKTS